MGAWEACGLQAKCNICSFHLLALPSDDKNEGVGGVWAASAVAFSSVSAVTVERRSIAGALSQKSCKIQWSQQEVE
eukprot:4390756-Prorocentrum_lima.AAC.1